MKSVVAAEIVNVVIKSPIDTIFEILEAKALVRTVLHEVHNLGQSVWLDTISRELIASGGLERWIEQGVVGVTTNPAIFEQAIAQTEDYDREIADLFAQGKDAAGVYEALTLREVGAAADILRPVYDRTQGLDGYVSLEVNPLLASDTDSTVDEAERLFGLLGRPNVMIKIPATPEGILAVAGATAMGVNVNATLIFSEEQYARVADAYLCGLSSCNSATFPASVASIFVSRVDTVVDKTLAAKGEESLCGRIAVDGARMMYQHFKKEAFAGKAWQELAAKGARVQRPLWASTGTKNPAYSDVKYVQELIGPNTVNTVPPKTITAFLDHGRAAASIEDDLAGARARLRRLEELGIDRKAICAKLLADGIESFNGAFRSLLEAIEKKAGARA